MSRIEGRKRVLLLTLASAALLMPQIAAAQVAVTPTTPIPTGGELPPLFKTLGSAAQWAFTKPLHLVIGGVAPGSGPGAGLGFGTSDDARWRLNLKAVATLSDYWRAQGEVAYLGEQSTLSVYGRMRDMPRLAFYGIGNETTVDDRTAFAMREDVVGTLATRRLASWLTMGARLEQNWGNVGRGRSTDFPSIGTSFLATDIPGMSGPTQYARYEASMNIRVPAALGDAFYQGARYRIAYAYFDDQVASRFAFTRIDLEAQQRFAMPLPQHRLTLHGWISSSKAQAGQSVPFYLQRTLGGKSILRSMNDNIIGSDGSTGTLRGFSELRFRDRNVLLLQAEYRLPVWGLFDATAYVDAGKVAPGISGLGVGDLKHNFGFSLSAMKGDKTAARVDVAFGGGEGYRLLFTFGGGTR